MNNKIKNPNNTVARFLSAQTISLLGSSLVQYAIIWHITLSTSSGAMITISTICGFAPQILVSLFGGALLDRYNRKKIIMLVDGIIAVSTLILAIVLLAGENSLWLVFTVLAVRSAGTGIQTPAVQSVLPQIVPSEKLMRVNGIFSTITSTTMFLSPAISGAILSVSNLEVTLFIDVITAIIGILITSTVAIPRSEKERLKSSTLQDIKAGFLYIAKNPFIRRLITFQAVVMFLISPSAFLMPLMVSRSFGAEVWRLTVTEMTYSIGSILGGILISAWGARKTSIINKNKVMTVIIVCCFYGMCMVGMGMSTFFVLFLVINMIIGISSPCYNTPITVLIQEKADSEMHGRIFSFMQIAGSCALPLGMMVFGPLADAVPIQILLITSGILLLIAAFIMFIKSKSSLKA